MDVVGVDGKDDDDRRMNTPYEPAEALKGCRLSAMWIEVVT